MEEDWKCIYGSTKVFEVEIIKGMLEENDITSIVINKQDSSYLFGEAELYVKTEDVLAAKHLISKMTL
jgi:hypothetical protein